MKGAVHCYVAAAWGQDLEAVEMEEMDAYVVGSPSVRQGQMGENPGLEAPHLVVEIHVVVENAPVVADLQGVEENCF